MLQHSAQANAVNVRSQKVIAASGEKWGSRRSSAATGLYVQCSISRNRDCGGVAGLTVAVG
jgi:hypothetical protein